MLNMYSYSGINYSKIEITLISKVLQTENIYLMIIDLQ